MNKTILIVDDDLSIISIFEFILQQAGYQVLVAERGAACLDIINSATPIDLIFLDIKIPDMSGIEIYKEIKKVRPYSLVIMMTGYTANELLKEAFELGAYGVIFKPFDMEEVLSLIEKLFKMTDALIPVNQN